MSAEKFWYEWLRVTMIIVILSGFALIILGGLFPIEFIEDAINKYFFTDYNQASEIYFLKNWLLSVCGTITVGWGFAMLYILKNTFPQKERWAWYSIFYPVLIWYFLDSTISLYFGIYFSLVINSVFLLQILAPLLFLRQQFFNKMVTMQ